LVFGAWNLHARMTCFYKRFTIKKANINLISKTATPYEIWECRGGQWVCVQKIFEIEISKLMRGGQPNPKDFRLDSDLARHRFITHINRMANRAKNRIVAGARKRAKFEQEHRPRPCG